MRPRTPFALMTTLLLAWAHPANAQTPPSSDFGLRGGLLGSTSYFAPIGASAGVFGHYFIDPSLRLGTGVDALSIKSTSSDRLDYDGQSSQALRLSVRGEHHPWPESTVDPWLGLALGSFYGERQAALDGRSAETGFGLVASAELGLAVWCTSAFALQAAFSLDIPLTHTEVLGGDGRVGRGTFFSGAGSVLPLPLLGLRFAL
ncbi:MAG TPA: hypothetical protein PLH51_24545 [Polyangiaceae bacterium]|nr:hypothetical protein [Polyangiaceae bacterium]